MDDNDEPLGDPWVDAMGLAEKGRSHAPLVDVLEEDLSQFLGRSKAVTLRDDTKLNVGLRRVVRQSAQAEIGTKPEVTVVVSRLS
jgi:ribonuclease J